LIAASDHLNAMSDDAGPDYAAADVELDEPDFDVIGCRISATRLLYARRAIPRQRPRAGTSRRTPLAQGTKRPVAEEQ
jgi:hypothetical protein